MFKSEKYLRFVRSHACLVCGSDGADAHHPRYSVTGSLSGMGMKRCGDDLAVPLCRTDHTLCHTHGREINFWIEYGIDPIEWSSEKFEEWKTSLILQQPNTRFACALVQLEDETDQPVEPQDIKRATKIGSVVSMLCRSEGSSFLPWLLGRWVVKEDYVSFYESNTDEQMCLLILKDIAGFESRADLKTNPEAVEKLEEVINEYKFT
mgnify:CR=1 FL=1